MRVGMMLNYSGGFTETVAELYQGLKENERAICELRLQGYQGREIAAELNLTEETVSRKLARIKDRLQRLCAPAG